MVGLPSGDLSVGAGVVGVVTSFPSELHDGARFTLEVRALEEDGEWRLCGVPRPRVLVTVKPYAEVRYGDLLRLRGVLSPLMGARNPGGFDYRGYLSSRSIDGTFKARSPRVTLLGEDYGPSFFVSAVGTQTGSSTPRPTNQRNRRLQSSCSIGWRSERTE